MSLDGVITFLGLLVAIFAIGSDQVRSRLLLTIGLADISLLTLSFLLIHYLEFYNSFNLFHLTPHLHLVRYGVTPKNAAYLLALLTVLFFIFRVSTYTLSRSGLGKFAIYINKLIDDKKFAECFDVFEKNLDRFFSIYTNKNWIETFKKRYGKVDVSEIIRRLNAGEPVVPRRAEQTLGGRIKEFLIKLRKSLVDTLPSHEPEAEMARALFRTTFIRDDAAEELSQRRPYLGVKILAYEFFDGDEFLDLYIRHLMANKRSVLFIETRNNQNLQQNTYKIEPENKLLRFFFSDPSVANNLGVWEPIGEFVIERLGQIYDSDAQDHYNDSLRSFGEKGCWQSDIFVGIRLFDIMVSRALYANIEWHMWLFYYRYFVSGMLENFGPGKSVDLDAEFPTPYYYMIYCCFRALCNLFRALPDLPVDQSNLRLDSERATHQNSNILKSSAICIGECLRPVIDSGSVTNKFKQDIFDMVVSQYFRLRESERGVPYSRVLIDAVMHGGSSELDDPARDQYVVRLIEHLRKFDVIPHSADHVRELRTILAGGPIPE